MTINFKNPKTKDRILLILNETPRITTKQIFMKLRKLDGWDKSYQSVHKILKEMGEDGIVEKDGSKYVISKEWLNSIQMFIKKESKPKVQKIGNYQIYSFNSISELDKFLFDFGKDFDKSAEGGDNVFWQAEHYWWPIAYSKEMYEIIMQREIGHKSKKIFCNNTKLDKWCAKYYERLGVEVDFKKSCSGFNAKYKNQEIELILPEEMRNKLNSFFNKVESFEDIDLKRFYRTILNKKSKIKAIVKKA